MAAERTLGPLRALDPAAQLEPLPELHRLALREAAMAAAPRTDRVKRRSRLLRVATVCAVVLLLTAGIAWASGALSPTELFQSNPQGDTSSPGGLWDQRVVAGSVTEAGSVDIPHVGAVGFWYGRTTRGGWCGALRLPGGDWLGTGKSPIDGGGTVPGCFPTRDMVNAASPTPVLISNGFDYVESDIDLRRSGGPFWRIRYGLITTPGAVQVADVARAQSAPVLDGGLFVIAVADPKAANPTKHTVFHLVAYGRDGTVVADDCPSCPSP